MYLLLVGMDLQRLYMGSGQASKPRPLPFGVAHGPQKLHNNRSNNVVQRSKCHAYAGCHVRRSGLLAKGERSENDRRSVGASLAEA